MRELKGRLKWLYENDPRYKALFDNVPIPQPPPKPPVQKPEPQFITERKRRDIGKRSGCSKCGQHK